MSHPRVTPEGQSLGRLTTLLADRGQKVLEAQGLTNLGAPGLRDDMCKTCACTAGSVPNGCLQTQLDFLKAAVEGERFLCHSPLDGRICAGWARARAEVVANPLPPDLVSMLNEHEYSPPDAD
jgi:hypothetical protein